MSRINLEIDPEQPTSLLRYMIGFLLSLMLTGMAYLLVTRHLLGTPQLVTAIVTLAISQVLAQLVFFLHLGRETRPRWKLVVFVFMLTVLGILIAGSLWIMQNLNYNMTPQDMVQYMRSQDGL